MTLARFSSQLPTFFDHFFGNELFDWSNGNYSSTNTTLPSVNIKDSDEGYMVEVAAPGLSREDFQVEVNQNMLIISSEKKKEDEQKEGDKYTRREFSYQSFKRSFNLPDVVDSEKIEAKYDNGVLRLSIPKKEEAKPKPPKMIQIK